jgi:inner membrane protein
MDPITQGTLGAVYAQSVAKKEEIFCAFLIGALAGMAPDLDILIRSASDPMLYFRFHRHFTHSLAFIPIGAFIVSCFLHLIYFRKKLSFKENYFYSITGYATHGLLDACTSYGTLLFWPFSDFRFAWNNVSIIDPLFTLPLIGFIFFTIKKRNPRISFFGIAYSIFYLSLGLYQNHRALEAGKVLAQSRGHEFSRIVARPSFANLYLWKVVYEFEGYFYVDAIAVGRVQKVFEGDKIQKLDLARDFPAIQAGSVQYQDIMEFKWFSDDYLVVHPYDPAVIGDARYSVSPDSVFPLWGIEIDEQDTDSHIKRVDFNMEGLAYRKHFLKLLFAK